MLNYIWGAMMLLSVIFGITNGRTQEVSSAVTTGAEMSVEVFLLLLSMLVFWGGIMNIAEKCGITRMFCIFLKPIVHLLFPEERNNPAACEAISMNIAANMLGLGNAATPFGLKAMKLLQSTNTAPDTASNSMIMFVVINTVSVQLLPTNLIALRTVAGSENPAAIIPAVLFASFSSAAFGVIITYILTKLIKYRGGKK